MRAAIFFILSIVFIACKKKKVDELDPTPTVLCTNNSFFQVNTNETLLSIFFTDHKTGFVGGSGGSIFQTIDSGKNWNRLNSTTNLPVRGLYFINDQKGFAVGGNSDCIGTGCTPPGSFILRTVDGGQSWTKVYAVPGLMEYLTVYFIDENIGFCAGLNVILKTIDGGRTWTELSFPNLGSVITNLRFISDQKGYAIAGSKMIKTNDGGNTWTVATTGHTNTGYRGVSGSDNATYISGAYKIIKSTDGGNSWLELGNSPNDIWDLHIDSNKGFAVGRGKWSGGDFGYRYGSIYCTSNGGITWQGSSKIKEMRNGIRAAYFPDAGVGYAIAENKVARLITE